MGGQKRIVSQRIEMTRATAKMMATMIPAVDMLEPEVGGAVFEFADAAGGADGIGTGVLVDVDVDVVKDVDDEDVELSVVDEVDVEIVEVERVVCVRVEDDDCDEEVDEAFLELEEVESDVVDLSVVDFAVLLVETEELVEVSEEEEGEGVITTIELAVVVAVAVVMGRTSSDESVVVEVEVNGASRLSIPDCIGSNKRDMFAFQLI